MELRCSGIEGGAIFGGWAGPLWHLSLELSNVISVLTNINAEAYAVFEQRKRATFRLLKT